MTLPSYFLPQPSANWDADTLASFDELYSEAVEPGTGAAIEYRLTAPKWQFLCYLCDQKKILVHGSGNADIIEFETRKSNDVHEFGNRQAVYAASDGIWPLFFAVMDRENYVTSLTNSCFHVIEAGEKHGPYYFFSINGDALPHQPWRSGMIYLLPADTFEQQARAHYRGVEIDLAQWASLVPVKPLAKLAVGPDDFPFLNQILPHDPAVIRERAKANPGGFPWMTD